MAGTFGHERANRPVAEALFAASWAPALTTDTVMATGFSCRAQAHEIAQRRLPHPVEVLAGALAGAANFRHSGGQGHPTPTGVSDMMNSMGNLWRASSAVTLAAAPVSQGGSFDLVIIGGGFTGNAAALEAAQRGAKVALLESETFGHGGSGRNVGLVNAGLWLPPAEEWSV